MLCQLATLPEIEAKIFDETALFFEDWRAQEIKSGAHPYDATKDEFYRRVTFLDYVKALNELCSKKPVVALPDTVEEAAFRKMLTLGSESGDEFEVFSRVADHKVPDLSNLSWDRVLDLRNHPQVERFRKFISELSVSLGEDHYDEAGKMFDELERKELVELAMIVKPNTLLKTYSAVATNAASLIPFIGTAIGVAKEARDVALEMSREKRFGWLYFGFDLEKT
jgi:hypothetical protein